MEQHTPEPWPIILLSSHPIILSPADYDRARKCVNALSDIADPEQWVADMNRATAGFDILFNQIKAIKKELNGIRGKVKFSQTECRIDDFVAQALSGIPDPAKWVEDMKAENERLKDLIAQKNTQIDNQEKFAQRQGKEIRELKRHILELK